MGYGRAEVACSSPARQGGESRMSEHDGVVAVAGALMMLFMAIVGFAVGYGIGRGSKRSSDASERPPKQGKG